MNQDNYAILGLQRGAGKEEIRKAYVKMLRQYTAKGQNDTEEFIRIRKAYEDLLNGITGVEDGPDYQLPDAKNDKGLAQIVEYAAEAMEKHDYANAVNLLQAALVMKPGDPYILYHLTKAQEKNGQKGNAVKTAQNLVIVLPKDKWAHYTLGEAYFRRGWKNKGLPEYEKAFELGLRELSFLANLTDCAHEADRGDLIIAAGKALLNQPTEYTKSTAGDALFIYESAVAEIALTDKQLDERFLSGIISFLEKNIQILDEKGVLVLIGGLLEVENCHFRPENVKRMRELIIKASTSQQPGNNMDFAQARRVFLRDLMFKDDRISTEWKQLATLKDSGIEKEIINEGLNAKEVMDVIRCDANAHLIKQWEDGNTEEYKIVKELYPELLEKECLFLEEYASATSFRKETIYQRIIRKLVRYSEWYPVRFFKDYPEEDPRRNVKETPESAASKRSEGNMEPIVHDKPVIGRNDPCPCGSGKKFKKCCMGKGIYD